MKASLRGDTLWINGHSYQSEDTDGLEAAVKPREVFEIQDTDNKIHLFYTNTSPFSNLYPAPTKIEGQTFHCSEQYYLYEQAKFGNDLVSASRILNAKDGKEVKFHVRKVSVDKKKWLEQKASRVMKLAVMEKFRQNTDLREVLMQTKGYALAECNPYDQVWGIGLHLKSPEALDETKWKGKNLLGQILGEVRQELS